MDSERERLVGKILKLLALASGTSFAAEAESARKLAEALIQKHNLAGAVDEAEAGSEIDRTRMVTQVYEPHFKGMKWEYILAQAVADLCGCRAYWFGDFEGFEFAGRAMNMEACLYILPKLHEQRIGEWLRYKQGGSDKFHKFSYGFARGVEEKIGAILRGGMLAAEREAVRLWYEGKHAVNHEKLGLGRASSGAGVAAGTGASLHRGELGGGRQQRLLR